MVSRVKWAEAGQVGISWGPCWSSGITASVAGQGLSISISAASGGSLLLIVEDLSSPDCFLGLL